MYITFNFILLSQCLLLLMLYVCKCTFEMLTNGYTNYYRLIICLAIIVNLQLVVVILLHIFIIILTGTGKAILNKEY